MHRQKLLQQLQSYQQKHPEEMQVVQRFAAFVAEYPRCFERDCWAGHITGSCWLVNTAATHILLTHHKKLDKWLQLGGHSDGDADTLAVALREAEEESGLKVIPWRDSSIFDLDVHKIPARRDAPEHYHFDVRYVMQVSQDENYQVSDESHDLAWVDIEEIEGYTREASIMRMQCKWLSNRSLWVVK